MSISAMKQALDLLETSWGDGHEDTLKYWNETAQVLRQAIAEAEDAIAAEREACANVCEDLIGTRAMARHCADAIRARGDASDISQEPVDKTAKHRHISYVCPNCHWSLNRQKPGWVGLTEEEREQVRSSAGYNQFMSAGEYAKAVQLTTEAKLKEKNVPQP